MSSYILMNGDEAKLGCASPSHTTEELNNEYKILSV